MQRKGNLVSRDKAEKQQGILKIVWFFFKPYKFNVIGLFILSLLVGASEAASIAAVYPILSVAFNTEAGEGNVILSVLRGAANLLPISNEFVSYCVVFLIIALLAFVAKLASINYRVRLGTRLVEENQKEVFSKFIKADYQYFVDHKQGELIYNVVSAPQQLSILTTAVTELMSQVILSVSVLIILFSLTWQGTVLVLLIGVGYHFFTQYLGKRVSYHAGKGEMEAFREGNVLLNEAITGIKQVKVFATTENLIDRLSSVMRKRWYHFRRRSVWQQVPTPILMLVLYITVGTTALLIRIVAPADFTKLIPLFGTFAFALFRLFPIIGTIGSLTMQVMAALPNCETVYSIQNDTITHIKGGDIELSSFKSAIQFNDVSFSYSGRSKILDGISMTFEKGKTTAIVGRSGIGKTTVINLLIGLFEPDEGELKIDGISLKEYTQPSWLNKIGFVDQDTFIFNDTVKNNITFQSGQYSDGEVTSAAKYADAHSFITELPEGYETLVGDKGMRLSAGQRQRIAVARAMIREPEILIFDEATNALDSVSEAAVQKAIEEISKDHTVIIIAHRFSTIVRADKILVLGNGRVLEEGAHEELVKKRGAYWELYRSQSQRD